MKKLTTTLGAALIMMLAGTSWADDAGSKQKCADKKAAAAQKAIFSQGFASLSLTPEQEAKMRTVQAEFSSKLGGILTAEQMAQLNGKQCDKKKL